MALFLRVSSLAKPCSRQAESGREWAGGAGLGAGCSVCLHPPGTPGPLLRVLSDGLRGIGTYIHVAPLNLLSVFAWQVAPFCRQGKQGQVFCLRSHIRDQWQSWGLKAGLLMPGPCPYPLPRRPRSPWDQAASQFGKAAASPSCLSPRSSVGAAPTAVGTPCSAGPWTLVLAFPKGPAAPQGGESGFWRG